jgi:hypothetical protein
MTQSAPYWLHSRRFDLCFFVGPAILSLAIVCPVLLGWWPQIETPLWAWLVLILGVDVSHVWSSLYRVYLDPVERRRRPWLYASTPIAVYLLGTLLYAANPIWFWTALAYVAVHHFVRQQVGFVALYRHRVGPTRPWERRIDHLSVYTGTLVPLAHWHATLPRSFNWFIEGDFVTGFPPGIMSALWLFYGAVAVVYGVSRLHSRRWNPGKDLVMTATWSVWFVGIVVTDSDFVFTATNVLIHGIPYMALVWLTTRRRDSAWESGALLSRVSRSTLLFVGLLLGLAFLEEGLWDVFIWKEHGAIFGEWGSAEVSAWVALLMVPLLSVPQATHYVLDGFIWRMDDSNPGLAQRVFGAPQEA